jgi:hypothetical protein
MYLKSPLIVLVLLTVSCDGPPLVPVTLDIPNVTVTNTLTLASTRGGQPSGITLRLHGSIAGRAALSGPSLDTQWVGPGVVDWRIYKDWFETNYPFTYSPEGVSTGHLQLDYDLR